MAWPAISVCGAVAKAAVAATNKAAYTGSPNLKTHLDIKRSFLLANSFLIMRSFNSSASAQLAPEEYAFSVAENTELPLPVNAAFAISHDSLQALLLRPRVRDRHGQPACC